MQITPRSTWYLALSVAEAAGIAVVATTYAALDRGLLAAAVPAILLAGAVEGLCLGIAQAWGLRRLGTNPLSWIGLTVAGAVLGYGLSLPGQLSGGAAVATADPPLWLMALAGAGLGLAMGAMMGLVQSPALPRDIPRRRWIAANIVGWAPAMAIIMTGAALARANWPLPQVTALGAVSGAAAGFCVALATWRALPAAD